MHIVFAETTMIKDKSVRDLKIESERLRDAAESLSFQMRKVGVKIAKRIDDLIARTQECDGPPRPESTSEESRPWMMGCRDCL